MQIGFDISQTGANKAGCGFFADAIISALLRKNIKHDYMLFPSFGDFFFDFRLQNKTNYISENVTYGPSFISRGAAGEFWTREDVESNILDVDIIHSNNFWCPQNLKKTKLIYTLYDMSFLVNPSWTTEANRIGCLDGVYKSSLNADMIIAISEFSRNHYLELFPYYPKERVRVVYPCSRFDPGKAHPRKPKALANVETKCFILSVGTIEPRKNQLAIAEAYAAYLRNGGRPYPLVFAGGSGWLMEGFEKSLNDLGIRNNVILTDYVSDEELVWLYKNCLVNIYMSFFEGFGLPVLEGMQYGAPTICSNTTSIPEVAGNGALIIDIDDEDGLVNILNSLILDVDRRNVLSVAAQLQASKFQWDVSANKILEFYDEVKNAKKLFDS